MRFRNLTQDGAQAQTELESRDAYWMLVPSGWKVKKHKRDWECYKRIYFSKIYILMPYFALTAFMEEIVKKYNYPKSLKNSFNGLNKNLV